MYIRRRVGRKRSFFRKHKVLLLFLAFAGACLFGAVFTRTIRNRVAIIPFRAPASARAPELIQKFQPARYETIVYPYSVIPGGVRSREELATAISGDRVVAAHFADFKVSEARIVKAEETRFVHVAYRLRNKVFWTAKTLKLRKGETLITDGRDTARTRCGNRVSAVPQEPVSEEEPVIETFDVPVLAKLDTPLLETTVNTGLDVRDFTPVEPYIPIEKPAILPTYYRPLFVVHSPDMVVPEPGTLGLLITGLAAFTALRFTRKK